MDEEKEKLSIYYEPHSDFGPALFDPFQTPAKALGGLHADVAIVPMVSQRLPFLDLVTGGERAVDVAEVLGAHRIVVLRNGEVEATGALASLVSSSGDEERRAGMELAVSRGVDVTDNRPGETVRIRARQK